MGMVGRVDSTKHTGGIVRFMSIAVTRITIDSVTKELVMCFVVLAA